jgi:hypothetical protein
LTSKHRAWLENGIFGAKTQNMEQNWQRRAKEVFSGHSNMMEEKIGWLGLNLQVALNKKLIPIIPTKDTLHPLLNFATLLSVIFISFLIFQTLSKLVLTIGDSLIYYSLIT